MKTGNFSCLVTDNQLKSFADDFVVSITRTRQTCVIKIKKIGDEGFDLLMTKLGNLHILCKDLDDTGIAGSDRYFSNIDTLWLGCHCSETWCGYKVL